MKSQKIANSFKNAMSTVFLLAGAFFVCSTLFSIRAVFADPIAPINDLTNARSQNGRAQSTRATNRSNPRSNATRTTATREIMSRAAVVPKNVVSDNVTPSRANARNQLLKKLELKLQEKSK